MISDLHDARILRRLPLLHLVKWCQRHTKTWLEGKRAPELGSEIRRLRTKYKKSLESTSSEEFGCIDIKIGKGALCWYKMMVYKVNTMEPYYLVSLRCHHP